jgi:hypothetical protein
MENQIYLTKRIDTESALKLEVCIVNYIPSTMHMGDMVMTEDGLDSYLLNNFNGDATKFYNDTECSCIYFKAL